MFDILQPFSVFKEGRMLGNKFLKIVLCCTIIGILTSCSTNSIFASKPRKTNILDKKPRKKTLKDKDFNALLLDKRNQVIDYASDLLGTRYRSGGTTPSGFDCSGFTSYVYSNFGINLDHNSTGQSKQGKVVNISMAQPGDVIVFAKNGRIHHVGLIVSVSDKEIMVVHSSSSKGVSKENILNSKYWMSRIHSVRDVISDDFANSYKD